MKIMKTPGVRVALGNFDGIHLGHRDLLDGLVQRCRSDGSSSVVVTFNPHPAQFFSQLQGLQGADKKIPDFKKIDSASIQRSVLAGLGIDAMLELPFDTALASMTAKAFVEDVLCSMPLKEITVGRDFRFGRGREGDSRILNEIGAKRGFEVHLVNPVSIAGQVVSSSFIRHLLVAKGDVVTARAFLTRPFQLEGAVVKGSQLGRKIGFPTANVSGIHQLTPQSGVYSGRMRVSSDISSNLRVNDWFACVVNIGVRPTVVDTDSEIKIEVHAYDTSTTLNLYGETLIIEFYERIRDEQKFATLDQLAEQIRRDIAVARRSLF
jgi:riboflavin kinase/FMN adenylyltransferase